MVSIQLIQQWILAIIDGDIYSEAERKNGDSNDDLYPPSWSSFSLPNLTYTNGVQYYNSMFDFFQ